MLKGLKSLPRKNSWQKRPAGRLAKTACRDGLQDGLLKQLVKIVGTNDLPEWLAGRVAKTTRENS